MNKGGKFTKPVSADTFRYAGLFVPSGLALYGLLLLFYPDLSPRPVSIEAIFTITACWLVVALIQFFSRRPTQFISALFLITYHALVAVYILMITGVSSPLAICWLLLLVVSFDYFSKSGFLSSMTAFAAVVLFDTILTEGDPSASVRNLVTYVIFMVISITLYKVSNFHESTNHELSESRANESMQRDRVVAIINNMTDAVITTDPKGIVKVYNASSLGLLDTNVSLNGHNIKKLLPLTTVDGKEVNIFHEMQKTKTVVKRDDFIYTYDDEDKIRLEITMVPIRSGYKSAEHSENRDGYILIMRDVTKEKSLEEERDEFISVVSHELRTPLAIAEGTISNAQVMLGHPDVTNDMLGDAMKSAHSQVVFLSGMVNDLSTLSRAERGVADESEDIDVMELAHMLHNKYVDEAQAKKLHLNLDTSPKLGTVHTSRLYLEELLQNIITNAIKYTKTGEVNITVKQSGDEISFAVKDTGIGISRSDQTKVFNKFFRSEDYRTRESSGTGLGLYIVAKLAHKIGTKINLTSRLNFGSTFSFTLPVKNDETLTK